MTYILENIIRFLFIFKNCPQCTDPLCGKKVSADIRLIKQHYPEIIIVGNKQTFGMIEGFYGVTGEQYLVKDGDFLALGRHKLRFYMTPMVHWPETMMTFDETDGVLFSGDGFGCFGTVDGGFLDTRINLDKYWGEMLRYYSNIVGKYGSPVQKALQKLGGLPFCYLFYSWTGVDRKYS